MLKTNILDIAMQNEVTSYLNIAYPMLFIMAEPKLNHWVKERFVHIYSQCWFGNYLRTDYTDSSRYFGDLLERQAYGLSEAQRMVQSRSMIDFIKESVGKGFASNVFTMDKYYLPEAAEFRKEHQIHEILVYGYDDNVERLNVIGYDRNGVFGKYSISYDAFNRSFSEALAKPPSHLRDAFHLMKRRRINSAYRFDLTAFILELNKLVSSTPDYQKLYFSLADESEAVFGLAVYDNILEQMERRLEGKPNLIVNFTTIHFISEHSRLLNGRFSFISDTYHPKSALQSRLTQYREVAQRYEAVRNGYLKQAMKESDFDNRYKIANEGAFESIYRMLRKTVEQEKELLADILTGLKREYC